MRLTAAALAAAAAAAPRFVVQHSVEENVTALRQHTDEVFKEFGFADDEIAALHAAKAV